LKSYISAVSLKKIKSFSGSKNYKEIQKILDKNKVAFLEEFADSSYIFDKRINNYLKTIVTEIYKSNATIVPTDFYFFIDKSPIPNAACHGNGIFTVNLGLFEMVHSDDELAFIISHELAHYVLNHGDKTLLSHVEKMNSKNLKRKVNIASRQVYGRRRAISELVKELNYDALGRNRNAEVQADSLGFLFFRNTKFNKSAAVSCLKKLDLSDGMLFLTNPQLKNHFNFDGYPFKDAWLMQDGTLFDLKEKSDDYAFDKDSLKSHPDIPLRVAKLQTYYNDSTATQPSVALLSIKKIASESSIVISVDALRMDLALYQILALSERNEIDIRSYCNTVAGILKRTYELKLAHQFGKYVSPISPFSEEKYLNETRTFLHNIELKNIRKIGLEFCLKHQSEMNNDAHFIATTAFFSQLNPTTKTK